MDKIKSIKEFIFKHSPGYAHVVEEDKTKTSKILNSRSKFGFTRLFAPGMHIEAQEYLFDKRLKAGFFRHFRYLGPRGEFVWIALFVLGLNYIAKKNINREESVESVLNDRNVYFKVYLPKDQRKII